MKNSKRILILLLLFIPLFLNAQWQKLDGPYGEFNVTSFAANENYVFASVYGNGIFRSGDKGVNWEKINSGIDELNVTCLFSEGSEIYAGSYTAIYHSSDNGDNWVKDNSGLTDSSITSIEKLGGLIYLATNMDGIFVQSISGPVTWLPSNQGMESNYTNSLFFKNDYLFASTYKGVFRKKSDDSTWSGVNSGIEPDSSKVNSIYGTDANIFSNVSIQGKNIIYKSADLGESWNILELPEDINNLSVLNAVDNIIYAVSDSGLVKSIDEGINWTDISNGLPRKGSEVNTIIYSSNRLYASVHGWDIYYSDDWGENWNRSYTKFDQPQIKDIQSHERTLFAVGMNSGIYSLSGSNTGWQSLNIDYDLSVPSVILVEDNRLLAGSYDGISVYNFQASEWKSYNDGFNESVDFTAVLSITTVGDYYYVGTAGSGFCKAHKDSIVWSKISAPFPDNNKVEALASVDTVIYAAINYVPVKSTDYGLTFDYAGDREDIYIDKFKVYDKDLNAFGFYGIYYIHDNSGIWTDISYNLKDNYIRSFAIHNDGEFISTEDSVYWKKSGDTVWTNITAGLPEYVSQFAVNPKYPIAIIGDSVYVGTENNGIWFAPVSSFLSTVNVSENILPHNFQLKQNYPNPFNPSTNIEFSIPEASEIRLSVYDILGREVDVLLNKYCNAGNYKIKYDASDLSSGIYIYRITSGKFSDSKKIILLK